MAEVLPSVVIHTDGACWPNPGGCGGWAAILTMPDRPGAEKVLSGAVPDSTNNRMELTAVIEGLSALKGPSVVEIVTDSEYVINPFQKDWIAGWQRRGWKKGDGQPVLNAELIQKLLDLVKKHRVTWRWIKGHNAHPVNERCDQLAVAAREKLANENPTKPNQGAAA